MQVVTREKTIPNNNASIQKQEQAQDTFLHFSLMDTLPAGHTLVINRALGTLSHIAVEGDRARLLGQQQFTASELSILLPVIESFPYYCPYEELFAHFYHSTVNEQTIARAREHLQQAQEDGIWDQEMRSVRNMLSRARLKARSLGLDVASILETGYILKVGPLPQQSKKQ